MMARRESVPLDCKVYVGELGNSGNRHELEDAFGYYGPLREVWVARNPPGFAFVMFQDARDARDAVRALDGKLICGRRVRVELSTGKSRHEKRGFRIRDGPGGPRGGYGGPGGPRDGSPRRPRGDPYGRGMPDRGPPGPNGPAGGRYDDRYAHRGRGYSRSRSRSPSPIVRGRPRTPPSRSRSRSPIPKSPLSDRYGVY
ncbi:uncharacterized protein LOC113798569 isoform X2 [Dermatophagoides pteronyssinus]|uniref:Serine/arginine-rich splicing factor 3-like isoform X2 n=1 Tax=Dermatophagoides pteronyssinus TaxID=6956 RepID=A0A6P6YHC9_DERPT|nr:serine/arginine-rich splicing factor 3-like isoform X2 [Dermatophagoides pteronyssinus]